MPKALITEANLQNIANAIRTKLGVETEYKPGEMAAAIASIPSGYPEPTGTIEIAQNGTVNVKDYASAAVNVSGGVPLEISNVVFSETLASPEIHNSTYTATNNETVVAINVMMITSGNTTTPFTAGISSNCTAIYNKTEDDIATVDRRIIVDIASYEVTQGDEITFSNAGSNNSYVYTAFRIVLSLNGHIRSTIMSVTAYMDTSAKAKNFYTPDGICRLLMAAATFNSNINATVTNSDSDAVTLVENINQHFATIKLYDQRNACNVSISNGATSWGALWFLEMFLV